MGPFYCLIVAKFYLVASKWISAQLAVETGIIPFAGNSDTYLSWREIFWIRVCAAIRTGKV